MIVRVQDYASAGNEVVCYSPDHGMLVKLLSRIESDGTFVLTSYNEAFDPIWTQDLTIMGVVREVRIPRNILNGNHGK